MANLGLKLDFWKRMKGRRKGHLNLKKLISTVLNRGSGRLAETHLSAKNRPKNVGFSKGQVYQKVEIYN
jgi:hypothetical protein